VNDRIDIALAIDADGVHIGQNDIPGDVVRKIINEDKLLGISATTIETAKIAEEHGADYIGTGAIYPTKTKDDSPCISLEEIEAIVNSVNIPILAIGGLNENNINKKLIDTGIKGICVVSAIMDSANTKTTTKKLKNMVNNLK